MSQRQYLERRLRHQPTGVILLGLVLLAGSLPAQIPADPPVRRAEAVTPVDEREPVPAWMQRVRPAEAGETRATVIEPQAEPTPYRPPAPLSYQVDMRVEDIPEPPAVPHETVPAEAPAEAPREIPLAPAVAADESANTIRFAPEVVQEELPASAATLQRADAFYARKMYDQAAAEYEAFLAITSKGGTGREAAYYRLGESMRMSGDTSKARSAYERLLDETRRGEFAGAAAYRLGEIYMDADIHIAATAQFELAMTEASSEAVRLSATFFAARCLEHSREFSRALALYEAVLKNDSKENLYRPFALAAAARLAVNLGQPEVAVGYYKQLAATAEVPEKKAEAWVQASKLLSEKGDNAEARELLEKASKLDGGGSWQGVATLGLLEIDYREKKFEELAKISDRQLESLPPESYPRGLLFKANSLRQLGQHGQALALYDRIMTEFSNQPAAREAQFQRLVCLFNLSHPDFESEVAQFIVLSPENAERDQAQLLKAEFLLKEERYAEAADAYGTLKFGELPDHLREDALYKRGWCLARAGQGRESAVAFSEFMEAFPESSLKAKALIQRAEAHQAANATPAAIRDYDEVIGNYPEGPEREIAMLQKALLLGTQQDREKMSAAFRALIEAYPESAARAQAEFWIGWADFEEKKYDSAIPHLVKARELDAANYGERASLRIILAHYYQENPKATAEELSAHNPGNVPGEVYLWLASSALDEQDYAKAEKFFQPLLDGTIKGPAMPELPLQMARAQLKQGKFVDSLASARRYLETTRDPIERARAQLLIGEAYLGQRSLDEAFKYTEEALLLQPEGRMNAQGRLLMGKIESARGNYDEAAKTFATIAILYDDPEVTPEALRLAAESFQKAGRASEAENAREELNRRFPAGAQAES